MTLTRRSLPILLSSVLVMFGACSPRDPAGLPQRDATTRRDAAPRRDAKVHDASIVLKDGRRRIDIDKAGDLLPAPDRYDPDLGYCSAGGPACYDALKHALLLCHCQDGRPLAYCFACAKKHATPAMIQLLSQAETCFLGVCSQCNVLSMKDIFYCAGGCPAAQACLADH